MVLPTAATVLFSLLISAEGYRFPALGRRTPRRSFNRRSQIIGDPGTTGVDNQGDITYMANLTVGGQLKSAQIDTGSSDIWVIDGADGVTDTGVPSGIKYARGEISGNVFLGPVEFAGFTIPDQAYINATTRIEQPLPGILGLGPPTGSQIVLSMNGSSAATPFLNRVFLSNASTPNFISFALSRNDDPTQDIVGEFTIGEVIEGYENITAQPKNPVQIVPINERDSQHWSVLVDSIIGPDGQKIDITTGVPDATGLVAVLDSGFSLPQVPAKVASAFYGRVQGASFDPDSGLYNVPCDQLLTASFVIGGVEYPIHPLDLVEFDGLADDGSPICIGGFQPNSVSFGSEIFDMILGDNFLRNTYTYINFGDFVGGNTSETADPYVQLLPLTDPTQAHSDFVTSRLGGVDTTSDPKYALLPIEQTEVTGDIRISKTITSVKDTKAKIKDTMNAKKQRAKMIIIYIAAGVGALVILGLLTCILCCCGFCACLGGRSRSSRAKGFGIKGVETTQVYQPLHAPAPISHPQEYGYQGKGSFA